MGCLFLSVEGFLSSRRVPIDVILFLKGMALMMRHVTVNLSQSHRK